MTCWAAQHHGKSFVCGDPNAVNINICQCDPMRSANCVTNMSISGPADLNHLTVGQDVRFDVSLSGLNSGDIPAEGRTGSGKWAWSERYP